MREPGKRQPGRWPAVATRFGIAAVARLTRRKRARGSAIGRVRVGGLAHLTSCQLTPPAAHPGPGPMWPRPGPSWRSTGPAWPRRASSPAWQRRGSGAVVLLLLLATHRRRPCQGRDMPVGKVTNRWTSAASLRSGWLVTSNGHANGEQVPARSVPSAGGSPEEA
jgi:hypothetical protein